MNEAFDRVQHVKLMAELAAVGIGGLVLAWINDYLLQKTQQVIIGDTKRDVSPCTRGILRGSVLGPLLFCIFVRHAPRVPLNCSALLFADDISLRYG